MNTRVDLSNTASTVMFLAAGLVLAYGVWTGRRDLGLRGAVGVLGTALLAGLPLPFLLLTRAGWSTPAQSGVGTLMTFLLAGGLGILATFLPVYVAVNWMEVIRSETRPR
ncbi:hypothetical protein GCM10010840_34360 [Deinococcus aerolatus]|uniref:Uncharacterized protein n=1 Tax=Deinococcus aerolatus TaxID=522487 RepID=A0ABQ2GF65_9DEIO|nr:hypothetical protein GCM10010840_34360 [Deinococcus aerolatus]